MRILVRFCLFFFCILGFLPSFMSESLSGVQPHDGVRLTENGLATDKCKMVTLIFAKGTTEEGNVGSFVGPAFIRNLRALLGSSRLAVQGVDYDASIQSFMTGGDLDGIAQMVNLIKRAAARCSSTQIVLGGYSQGAQLVHNAASKLSSHIISRIIAVVLFGDPDNGQGLGSISASDPRVDSICHDQDIVCMGGGGLVAHFTYTEDAYAAAQFVMGQAGLLD